MQLNVVSPEALWGLAGVALLVALSLRNRRRAQPSFSWRRVVLWSLAFTAGVLAIARPQLGRHVSVTRAAGHNVFFAIDISQSMMVEDIPPSRLHFATSAVQLLLEKMEGARAAVFPFAADGYLQIPLTTDREAIYSTIPVLSPSMTTAQGTDFASSLETLLANIQQMETQAARRAEPWAPTQVILLSDGETHHRLDERVLQRFRAKQIPIHAVGVGTFTGGVVPAPRRLFGGAGPLRDRDGRTATSRLDEKPLRRIAELTGGEYVGASLEAVTHLASQLRQSVGLSQVSTRLEVDRELYPWLLLVAFLLLAVEMGFGRWDYVIRVLVALWLCGGAGAPLRAEADVEKLEARIAETRENETRAALRYNIGNLHWKAGRKAQAAESYQEAAYLTERPELKKKALYNYGNVLLQAMDPKGALETYQEAYDIKLEDAGKQKKLNRDISENMELAAKMLERMQKNPQKGDGEGGGQGQEPQDPGKAKKDYQAERFSADRKRRILEVISTEEQQILQKLQRKRAGKDAVIPEERPW